MATRVPTVTLSGDSSVITVTYPSMANGDDGSPVAFPEYADRSAQVTGTFGAGGTLRIEGSLDGGTNYFVLTDPQGNNLDYTAAKIEAITEAVGKTRPRVTAGDGTTALVVTMILRRAQPLRV